MEFRVKDSYLLKPREKIHEVDSKALLRGTSSRSNKMLFDFNQGYTSSSSSTSPPAGGRCSSVDVQFQFSSSFRTIVSKTRVASSLSALSCGSRRYRWSARRLSGQFSDMEVSMRLGRDPGEPLERATESSRRVFGIWDSNQKARDRRPVSRASL